MLMEDSNKSPKETEKVKHWIIEVALVKYHILVLHNQFFFFIHNAQFFLKHKIRKLQWPLTY